MELAELEKTLKNRLDFVGMSQLALLTANREILCDDIIHLCVHKDQQIGFRASWTLELVASVHFCTFLPHIKYFLKLYPCVSNPSVQRSFTKILMMLTHKKFVFKQKLNVSIFDDCLTATFDWLLHPKTPLAVQCNAMDVIFQLSPYHHWILDELKIILQQKLVSKSPALISRSKKILKHINPK